MLFFSHLCKRFLDLVFHIDAEFALVMLHAATLGVFDRAECTREIRRASLDIITAVALYIIQNRDEEQLARCGDTLFTDVIRVLWHLAFNSDHLQVTAEALFPLLSIDQKSLVWVREAFLVTARSERAQAQTVFDQFEQKLAELIDQGNVREFPGAVQIVTSFMKQYGIALSFENTI
jgi:hypothetical protein